MRTRAPALKIGQGYVDVIKELIRRFVYVIKSDTVEK